MRREVGEYYADMGRLIMTLRAPNGAKMQLWAPSVERPIDAERRLKKQGLAIRRWMRLQQEPKKR